MSIVTMQQNVFFLFRPPEYTLENVCNSFKKHISSVKLKFLVKFLTFYFKVMNNYLETQCSKYANLLDTENIEVMQKIDLDKEYDRAYAFDFLYEDYEILKRKKGRDKNFDELLKTINVFVDNHAKHMNYLGMIESKLVLAA